MQTKFLYIQFINCLLRTRARTSWFRSDHRLQYITIHWVRPLSSSSSLSQKFRKMKETFLSKVCIIERDQPGNNLCPKQCRSQLHDIELLFRRGKDSLAKIDFAKYLEWKKKEKKVNNLFGKISSGVNCCKSPPNDAQHRRGGIINSL